MGVPLRRMMVAALALGVVAGCAAVPRPDAVQALSRPAVSTEAAAAAIKRYDEVSNAANKRRDDKLIATVETGELLRQSQAGYKIGRVLDKAGKDLREPTTHVKPSIGAPTYGGYPMYFVSSAGMSAYKDYRALDLWERKTAGSRWLMKHSVYPANTVKLPPLTALRPLTAADSGKLAASPEAAGEALAEYLTGGAKSPRAALFAPSGDITAILTSNAKAKAELLKDPKSYRRVSDSYTVTGSPQAFLATSGEALVFLSVTDDYLIQVGPNLSVYWRQGSNASAFSPPTAEYKSALTETILYQVALVIPPKGGKIRVLSTTQQLVDAGGY
jgi:hypothetical protein